MPARIVLPLEVPMTKKRIPYRYFWLVLVLFLAACTPVATPAPTETLVLSVVPPTLTATVDIPTIMTPSPIPTQRFLPIITPDAIQVKRWEEYQTALAKSALSYLHPEEVLCEWDILGASAQVLYIWVVCESTIPFGTTSTGTDMYSSLSTPALIRLDDNGSIQNVEIPAPGTSDYKKMFPDYVQEEFEYYRFGKAKNLSNHIQWRRTHPNEPPLIILSATSLP